MVAVCICVALFVTTGMMKKFKPINNVQYNVYDWGREKKGVLNCVAHGYGKTRNTTT